MRKKLLFLVALALTSIPAIQANSACSYTSGKNSDNLSFYTNTSKSDTLAIPWQEDFESITVKDDLPYGMSCTYAKSFNKKVQTFLTPYEYFIIKEKVKARSGSNYMVFASACNDWVFTPGLFLRAGTEYTFSFWCDTMHANWVGLEAKVGLSATPEGMTIRITDSIARPANAGYKKYEGSFVAAKDAVYYFGIHAVNTVVNHYLAIDDLEVNITPPACKAVNLFARNITTTSIDFYRVYTPVKNYKMTFNYRKKGDASWNIMDVSNQENIHLSGLTDSTNYEARLGVVCSPADTLWTPISTVKTAVNPPANPGGAFPIKLNFDGTDVGWNLMNDSLSATCRNYNKWYIDSLGGKIFPGRTVAYISSNGGNSNIYTNSYQALAHLYTDNFLLPQAEEFFFSFSWRIFGKSSGTTPVDFLRVLLADTTINLKNTDVNKLGGLNIFGADLNLASDLSTKTAILPGTYSNTLKKLVFVWRNDNTAGAMSPAAAIDSVIFRPISCAAPKELSIKKITSNSFVLTCNAVMGSNASFEIAYKKQGTPESDWSIRSGLLKMDSLLLDRLEPNTGYDIKVRKRYGVDSSFWTSTVQGKTTFLPTQPGLNEDFESFNAQRCFIVNDAQPNKWTVGSNADGVSDKAIYVSKDDGASNQYNNKSASIVHFYYDLNFAQAKAFRLSFDWKGVGQSTDFLRVSLIDLEVTPEAGKMLPVESRIFEKDFFNRRTLAHEELFFDQTYTGKQKRLVFTWKNVASEGGVQPATVIDNIRFDAMNCYVPENVMTIGSDQSSITFMTKKPESGNSFVVNYKKIGPYEDWYSQAIPQSAFISQDKFKLTQLEQNTAYEIKVRKQCGTDTSFFTPVVTARTIQVPASLTLSENFETETSYSKWRMLNEGQTNQWMVGSAVSHGGTKSAYITNADKTGNTYDASAKTVVHFYRDIKFSEAKEYELRFDWKGGNANSFMSVYVADINQTIEPGTFDSRGAILDGIRYSGSADWKNEKVIITRGDQLSNTTRSLVFTWVCDGTGGEQAPFSIDNIELEARKCSYPKDVKFISFPASSLSDKVEIQFSDIDNVKNYVVACDNLENQSTLFAHTNTTQPTISGLKSNTDYIIKVSSVCTQTDTSFWSKSIKFRMPQKFATLPFFEDFEHNSSTELWTRVNGENTNKWFFGSATYASGGGSQAAYIDSLDGNHNGCKAVTSVVHLYRDIDFPMSDADFPLSFQWKEKSERKGTSGVSHSYFRISIIDVDIVPVSGEELSQVVGASQDIYTLDDNLVWNNTTLMLPKNLLAGKKKRLVFSWRNRNDWLAEPPVAIDNISMTAPECSTPQNLRFKALSPTSIQLNWACKYSDTNKFQIEVENNPQFKTTVTDTFATLINLKSNTPYNISVTNECGGKYNAPVKISLSTIQQTPTLPFYEKFDDPEQIAEWTFVNGNNKNKWIIRNINSTEGNINVQNAAFVSNDGVKNFYVGSDSLKGITGIVHTYRDVYFDNTDKLSLSFDWRAVGNSDYDYMKVYLADSAVTPVLNTLVDKKYEIVASDSLRFALQQVWKKEYFTLRGEKNTRKRLIFSWYNALKTEYVVQTPAAFSNIQIQAIDCTTPSDLTLKSYIGDNAVLLTWQNVGTNYMLRYRQTGGGIYWDTAFVNGRNYDTLKLNTSNRNVNYEVQVQNNCGQRSAWSPIFYFNTLQEVGSIPFTEDFAEPESREQWNIVNGTQINAWHINTAVYAKGNGNYAAYISNNYGVSNTYTVDNPEKSIVHLYRDIEILPGQKELQLLLDWKAYGQNEQDYMQVYLIHKDSIPKAKKQLPAASLLATKKFALYKHNWKRENIVVPANTFAPGRNRLVFTWINNNISGDQTPIAIDNIAVNMSPCLSPINILSTAVGRDSVALKWNTQKEIYSHFNLRYRKIEKGNDSETWEEELITSDSNYVLRNLRANRLYEIQLQTECLSDTSVWKSYFVQTSQISTVLPLSEDFESDTAYNAWTFCNGEMVNAWFIDTAAEGSGSRKTAYISDEGGRTYHYAGEGPTIGVSHFYKDITFPPAVEYQFSFNWQAMGDYSDYLNVFLADINTLVLPGIAISNGKLNQNPLYGASGWAGMGALLPDTLSGKTKRLVFSWVNNFTKATQNPAAVDNIVLRALDCKTPTELKLVDYPDLHSAVIAWKSEGDTFTVSYGRATDPQPWPEFGVRDTTKVTLTGLDSNTIYNVKVKNSCAEKTIFSSPVTIRTLNTPITTFPSIETFEKDSPTKDKWIVLNGNQTNAWYIGKNTAAKGGEQSMYISNNGGDSNFYDKQPSITHFYRDITLPESGAVEMSFDWKSQGMGTSDFFQVALVDIIKDPKAGEPINSIVLGKYSGNKTEWRTSIIAFPDSLRGERKRVVFTWVNSYRSAEQPPAAVDNIIFNRYNCSHIQNLQAETKTDKQVAVSWQGTADATGYTVSHKLLQDGEWIDSDVQEANSVLNNLIPNIYYLVKVAPNCDLGLGKPFYDTVLVASSVPYLENFNKVPDNNWKKYTAQLPVTDSVVLSTVPTALLWTEAYFANVAYASKAAKIATYSNLKEWLVSPQIYLAPETKMQLEFNIALTFNYQAEVAPDKAGVNDRLVVLISKNDNKWYAKDALLTWDNKGCNREYNKINYTREGDKIKVSLENYSGLVRIAFYIESPGAVYNDLFLDSIVVRPIVCEKVQDVHVSKIGLDSATVAWTVSDADQYKWQVKCAKLDGTPVETEELIELDKLKINTLEMNTEYNVSVRSICTETDTSAWFTKNFTTASTCVGIPDGINVTQTHDSATITWETQPTHEKWELRYGLSTQSRDKMPSVVVTTPTYIMRGLQQLTDYTFYIRAICIANDTGNWTEKQTYKTLRTPCTTISNLNVKDVKVSNATVTWDAAAAQSQWEIRYGLSGTSLNTTGTTFVTTKTKPLTNLLQNTTYDCYVRGICGAGDTSIWSTKATYTTLECTTVENLRFTKNNEGKSILNWTAGTGHTSWIVNIVEKATSATVGIQTVNDTTFTIDYTTLKLDTKKDYTLSVKANCNNNASQYWSDPITLSLVGILTVDANQNIKINLSPNPAQDIAKLSIEGATGLVTVQIYSVKGELINTANLYCEEGKIKEMKITGLPQGSYIIRLLHEKWVTTEKLIVN